MYYLFVASQGIANIIIEQVLKIYKKLQIYLQDIKIVQNLYFLNIPP